MWIALVFSWVGTFWDDFGTIYPPFMVSEMENNSKTKPPKTTFTDSRIGFNRPATEKHFANWDKISHRNVSARLIRHVHNSLFEWTMDRDEWMRKQDNDTCDSADSLHLQSLFSSNSVGSGNNIDVLVVEISSVVCAWIYILCEGEVKVCTNSISIIFLILKSKLRNHFAAFWSAFPGQTNEMCLNCW